MLSRASGRRVARMAPPWFSCLPRAMVTPTIGAPFFVRDSTRPVSRRELSSLPPSPNQDGDSNKRSNSNSSNRNDSLPIPAATPTTIANEDDDDHHEYDYDYDDIDFAVSARIEGEESQIATITLRPGERLRAESGSMIFMTEGVTMETTLAQRSGGGGSSLVSSAISRVATGQNLFLTDFWYDKDKDRGNGNTSTDGSGTVALGTDFPSKILKLSLGDHGGSLVAQKGAFLASSNPSVTIEMEFTRTMTAGFFGGEGFVLQRLVGDGTVLVRAGGAVVERELSAGEVLRVTSGSIVAFEPGVSYDVQTVPGIRNAMFGGEGLFVTALTGPGRVWLQGLPPDRTIAAIASRVPAGSGIGIGPVVPIGGGGGGGGDGGGVESGPPPVDPGVPIDADAPGAEGSEGFGTDSDNVISSSPSSSSSYSNAPGEASESAPETTYTDGDGVGDGGTADAFGEPYFPDENTTFSTSTGDDHREAFFGGDDYDDVNESAGGYFDDPDATEIFDNNPGAAADAAEEASEAGSSLLSTLWDIFMGD